MTDPDRASLLVRAGIAGLAVLVALVVLLAIARVERSGARRGLAAGAVAIWLGGSLAAALSGALAHFESRPPPLGVMLVLIIGASIAVARSSLGRRLAEQTPLAWIIGLQAFRLPLELIMHQAAIEGVMPNEMSFSGYNFDIVTGVTALIVAPLVARGSLPRPLIWAWNCMGMAFLVIVVTIALLATPIFKAFGDASLNTWIAHAPFVWLPAVLVATALMSHLLIFRALALRPQGSS